MAWTLKIEPITRIEGHVDVDVHVSDAQVVESAKAIAALVRGFEVILRARHPWDAPYITSRICGVCATTHHNVSVRALDSAFGVTGNVPLNAILERNIIQAAQMCVDNGGTHPYALAGPDYGILADYNPMKPPAGAFPMWFEDAVEKGLLKLVMVALGVDETTARLAIPGIFGVTTMHDAAKRVLYNVPDHPKDPGAHYLDAVKAIRLGHEVVAIWAGKFPHIQSPVPGGITTVPTLARITMTIGKMLRPELKSQVVDNVERDVKRLTAIATGKEDSSYNLRGALGLPDEAGWPVGAAVDLAYQLLGLGTGWINGRPDLHGTAYGNFICYGVYPQEGWDVGYLFPPGVLRGGFGRAVEDFDHMKVAEEVPSSWYTKPVGRVHPWEEETELVDPAAKPEAYSWAKSVLYDGERFEAGPLSRFMVLKTRAPGAIEWEPLNPMGSTLDRHVARSLHGPILYKAILDWAGRLDPEKPVWYSHAIRDGKGFGNWEAPRGALGHWVVIEGGRIKRYQVITPTTWNLGPRDAEGRPGPIEKSVEGIRVPSKSFLEAKGVPSEAALLLQVLGELTVVGTIHSFDICTACCVHYARAGGRRIPPIVEPFDFFNPSYEAAKLK